VYNYEEGGEMKEMETRRSLKRRKRCLRWKLSIPRVRPIAGPLTVEGPRNQVDNKDAYLR